MDVESRIEQASACTVINLSEDEADVYSGAGWKLARFENGVLVELFDPLDQVPARDDLEEEANEALNTCLKWVSTISDQVWLVMCSGYQLCEPTRFDPMDALSVARLGRVIGESLCE